MASTFFRSDRRCFLTSSAGMGAFFAAHGLSSSQEAVVNSPSPDLIDRSPRIRRLELLTSASLEEMKVFYRLLLGDRVADQESNSIAIDAGQTRITFLNVPAEYPEPFYHFAFNIPEKKLLDAHQWLSQRTALIPIPQHLRDPDYPDDVVHYRHWNAHSLFFFDPGGNVVELIARHDLDNAAHGKFSSDDILYASEIAFVVDDVAVMQSALANVTGFMQYKGASDAFAAIGDEHGLILLMKRGRMISFDAPEMKTVTVYPTKVACRGKQRVEYRSAQYPYELTVDQ